MNKDKIKEALRLALDHLIEPTHMTLEYVPPASALRRAADAMEKKEADIRTIQAVLAELDKAQQPGKVLTDGLQLERIITLVRGSDLWRDMAKVVLDMEPYEIRLHETLVSARDNGYLAPAVGLTAEEVDQCMDEVGDPPDNPDHFWQWREKFRARLTAALNAKNTKP